jgi:hypothetical protein
VRNAVRKANGGPSDASSLSLRSSVAAIWFILVANCLVCNNDKRPPSMFSLALSWK